MGPVVVRTWAPRAHTPIIFQKMRCTQKTTVIGALCARADGKNVRMFMRIHPHLNINKERCLEFLRQLKQNINGPIMLIWDRLPAHRAMCVKKFCQEHGIQIEYLPPYAPELNPIEYAWSYLKTKPLAKFCPHSERELNMVAKEKICEMRKKRELLKSFLRLSGLFN
jgi:transposase